MAHIQIVLFHIQELGWNVKKGQSIRSLLNYNFIRIF